MKDGFRGRLRRLRSAWLALLTALFGLFAPLLRPLLGLRPLERLRRTSRGAGRGAVALEEGLAALLGAGTPALRRRRGAGTRLFPAVGKETLAFAAGGLLLVAAAVASVLLPPPHGARPPHPPSVAVTAPLETGALPRVPPAAVPAPRPVTTGRAPKAARPPHAGAATPPAAPSSPAPPPSWRAPLSGRIVGGFGWSYRQELGEWAYRPGIDVAAAPGTPVTAMAAGVVTSVRDGLEGTTVVESVAGGFTVRYRGLVAVSARPGEVLGAGTPIGAVGAPSTGFGLPAHVGIDITAGGRPVDPLQLVPAAAFQGGGR